MSTYSQKRIIYRSREADSIINCLVDHCIEHLRQSLICSADITPQRFSFDREHYAYSLETEQQFKCKSWEDIWSWAESRNTTGDYPSNLRGLEQGGKKSDAGEVWKEKSMQAGQLKSPT